jgi:hypothetical protein
VRTLPPERPARRLGYPGGYSKSAGNVRWF